MSKGTELRNSVSPPSDENRPWVLDDDGRDEYRLLGGTGGEGDWSVVGSVVGSGAETD